MKKTFLTLLLLIFLSSCLPINSLFLGQPDRQDFIRFPHRNIASDTACFTFFKAKNDVRNHLKVNDWTSDIPFFVSLDELLKTHQVRSFLVIQQDTLLYEYYGQNTTAFDLHPSYSIAKSFTSTLIGIAIDEGRISDEQQLVTDYIPELKGQLYSSKLTIEHLLNHTSGIKYRLDVDALIYYGKDVVKSLKRIKFAEPPGTKQHYLNINVQLLGLILYRATGVYPSQYLESKIWKPIQMCSNGIWTIDKRNELEKTFCCMGATALDYAKFGRLYLHQGEWNGQRIFSKEWYHKSIQRDTTSGSSFNYNYCWHIGLKAYGDFMANGLYKQHIYIHPEKELIIVLLNNKEKRLSAERVNWWYIFRQIADQL